MARIEKNKNDARVIKTRAKLFGAFAALLSEKPFEEINVYEICDAAGVRRATFYQHFADKHDFLALMVDDLINEFNSRSKESTVREYGAAYHVNFTRELLHFLCDNEIAVRLIIKSNMVATLVDIIIKEIHKEIVVWLCEDVRHGKELIASAESVAMMLSGGIASIIVKWFASDKPIPLSELISEIEAIIYSMFKN